MSITDVIKYESDNHTFLSGNTLQRISIQARNSSSTKPKKQFSSLNGQALGFLWTGQA